MRKMTVYNQKKKISFMLAVFLCLNLDLSAGFASRSSLWSSKNINAITPSLVITKKTKNNLLHPGLGQPSTKIFLHKKRYNDINNTSPLSMATDMTSPSASSASLDEGESDGNGGDVVVVRSMDSNTDNSPLVEGIAKGVVRDYRMRLPFYKSDIKDGLNVQVRF
jgi:hypothetical protein